MDYSQATAALDKKDDTLKGNESIELTQDLKEFDKLDALLSQIPKKAQHGLLKSCDLILTCIDASKEYIALGCNVGVVFLYSRKTEKIQKFRSTGSNDVITSIKFHEGIDFQLAIGTASGDVTVFCVPGFGSMQKNQIQKFDVKGFHQHYVTCVEWSTNGMKLFTGDKRGQVIQTEVDFYEGMCKSSLLLIESATEIVQLDYLHKVLLVSTKQRSFVVRLDLQCQVVNIGVKERKITGSFGACFMPGLCKTDDAKLYCSRPNCRLWLSDIKGTVKSTHKFSEPLSPSVPEIPLILAGKLNMGGTDFQFGLLQRFRNQEIVTWSSSVVVVLDPLENRVVACQSRLSGIDDIAVVGNEIFLLRRHADARVIRISDQPDKSSIKVGVPKSVLSAPVIKEKIEKVEEKDSAGAGKNFFTKAFGNQMKKFENLLKDKEDNQDGYTAEPVIEAVSPDLPPLVMLPTPELENLRIFTGALPADSEAPTKTADLPPTELAENEDMEYSGPSALSTLMSATSILSVVSSVTTDPEAFDTNAGLQESPKHFETPSLKSGSSVSKDSSATGIVFSHRMKKPKKKKSKAGKSPANEKEEDTVSQVSTSSQVSDEVDLAPKSCNIPLKESSPLEALRNADDILQRVDNMLNGTSASEEKLPPDLITSENKNNLSINLIGKANLNQKDSNHLNDDNLSINFSLLNTDSLANEAADTIPMSGIQKSQSYYTESKENNTDLTDAIVIQPHEAVSARPYSFQDETLKASHPTVTKDERDNVLYALSDELPLDTTLTESDQSKRLESNDEHKTKNMQDREQDQVSSLTYYDSKDPSCQVASDQSVFPTYGNKLLRETSFDIISSAFDSLDSLKSEPSAPSPKLQNIPKTFKQSFEESFQDIYGSISEIESQDPFNKGIIHGKPADDFYSEFMQSPQSPEMISPRGCPAGTQLPTEMHDVSILRVANTWSEFNTPTNMYSLVVSSNHIWFTDKVENIYYSSVANPKGIVWRKATGSANQISVSPSGYIVWRLHRGVVYAGTKISSRHPEGLKWVEAVREVEWISVGDNCAWYIKRNGEVMMQRSLSFERPCYRSKLIKCEHKLRSVHCAHGVVWAITEGLQLLIRTGVSNEIPEGEDWLLASRESPPYLFSSVAVDSDNTGWAIDVLGQIWFCPGVTRNQPTGAGHWWQVPMSEYIVQEASTLDMIRNMARKFDPKHLSYILSTNRGGLITAGAQGVWLALDFRNVLQVCRSSILGYHWREAQPAQMSPVSTWKTICANVVDTEWGQVWAVQTNGDMYAFRRPRGEATMIPNSFNFCCLSISPIASWALTPDGEIKIRTGMNENCPQGTNWVNLDLSQLGDAHFVHISCNSLYVWAVEAEGVIYHRIGAKAPSDNTLSPVWLPIDTFAEIVFTRVHAGPLDWMVWAVDNRRLTYVRVGITENLPIGEEWVHVPGIQAVDLSLTNSGIWALTPNGEVYFRYGVSRGRPSGNYWKKIPGTFVKISASYEDDLWGVNTEGHLMHCSTRYLLRRQDSSDPLLQGQRSSHSSISEDVDWEIV